MTVVVTRGHAAIRAVQEIPLNNSFCTGSRSSCPVPERDAYASPLHPDGELATRVRQRLDEGQGLREIALAMDLHWKQVLGVAMNVPSPPHVVHGNRITEPAAAVPAPNGDRYAELPDVTAPEGPPSSPSGTGSMIFESGDAA